MYRDLMVRNIFRYLEFFAFSVFDCEDGIVQTDSFDNSGCKNFLIRHSV